MTHLHEQNISKSSKQSPDKGSAAAFENLMMASSQMLNAQKSVFNVLDMNAAFINAINRIIENPENVLHASDEFFKDASTLFELSLNPSGKENPSKPPVICPELNDRRFKHPLWEESPIFDFTKQMYLLSARWMKKSAHNVKGLEQKDHKKIKFITRQITDLLAPSNFPWSNPQVIAKTLETQGQNLTTGFERLINDLSNGRGLANIANSNSKTFQVGENIAATKGEVIYQNELIQLIQYNPTTKNVFKIPLLIIPAWINKFYIFDLQGHNSFIKWAIDQGHTVFIISWINPDKSHAHKTFEDYMMEGPMAALKAIDAAIGESKVNAVGFCLGGILLTCLLAYLGRDASKYFNNATLLATTIDFSKVDELLLFTDKDQASSLEKELTAKGYLDGAAMTAMFNMMRANDLIWPAFINNYLLAQDLSNFDLLYWNADSTHLPAAMYRFYIKNMFQQNLLKKPGGLTLLGRRIDLAAITVPTFILGAKEDHIAPWKSVYPAVCLFSGPNKFVLSGSGHIAGVINPPNKNKYGYWTNLKTPAQADDWLLKAAKNTGSWWQEWGNWLKGYGGQKVKARDPMKGNLITIEHAPGSYVKLRTASL